MGQHLADTHYAVCESCELCATSCAVQSRFQKDVQCGFNSRSQQNKRSPPCSVEPGTSKAVSQSLQNPPRRVPTQNYAASRTNAMRAQVRVPISLPCYTSSGCARSDHPGTPLAPGAVPFVRVSP